MFMALVSAACGGGGGTGVHPVVPPSGPATIALGSTPQTVTLGGGGYSVAFGVPAVTGNAATMTATLQTSLPSGVSAPQTVRRSAGMRIKPETVGGNVSALVYVTVQTNATIQFSTAPSFQFTLPAGTTIPSGSSTYLLFWDPYVGGTNGWITLLGPGSVSGQNVTFASVQTAQMLNANTQYVYALGVTTQAVATAAPVVFATSTAVPAYCTGYSTPVPNANSSPQPVYFTDNSGLNGTQVVLYVVTGAPPSPAGATQTQYLAANGTLTNFTPGATAAPLPLSCFPGSTHKGTGLTFELPPPTNANQGADLYIAYATPVPSPGGIPNPLTFEGVGSGGGFAGPNLDWFPRIPNPTNTATTISAYAATPWDFVEYTLPSGITDVTQVDKVGLPLQLTQGSTTVGFQSGQYEMLLSQILADPTFKKLAVSTQMNGRSVLARILAPQNGEDWGFPQDWWYNSSFNPAAYVAAGKGYVGYILSQYQTTPRLYALTSGIDKTVTPGNYCASSDGTSNVLFISVGTATTCSPLPVPVPNPTSYTMNVAQTLEGSTASDAYQVCHSAIFSMPYSGAQGPGGPLLDPNEFFLWKAMVIDISRGAALQNTTHPVGGWSTAAGTAQFSQFFTDPVSNTYAKLVHTNMFQNLSYALPYDEPGGLAPAFTSVPNTPLQITVWNIPPYSGPAVPTATASPLPCPT